jgi:uncharacterized membrane protein
MSTLPSRGHPPVDDEHDLTELVNGELPSADTVEAYEQVLPGAADRIMSMLEQQSQHRMQLESALARSAARTERLRELLGIGFVLVVFVVATRLITGGHELPGTLLAVLDLGLLAAVYLSRSSGRTTPGVVELSPRR